MTINDIEKLNEVCTGCLACADICPASCIESFENVDGFLCSEIDSSRCINCGKCYAVCPAENKSKNDYDQRLYAAFACDKDVRNRGSSGGVFEVIASWCLENDYYVCGAAFDGIKLEHRIIKNIADLKPLLKSKYIQSNTQGVYKKIFELLRSDEKVLFCGTPCQVSALNNYIPDRYKCNLIVLDFICHGVPSQRTFDMYIESLECKHKGKISDFTFRVKDNKYKHSHGYCYSVRSKEKTKKVNGVYSLSSYYNAFKQYIFFRESCYSCKYATLERVSDITLADFWGIEKYDSTYETDKGVSMIITNTQKGCDLFDSISNKVSSKEFPIGFGVDSNRCLTQPSERHKKRDDVINSLKNNGYEVTAERYFKSSWKNNVYWLLPSKFRTIVRKLRG